MTGSEWSPAAGRAFSPERWARIRATAEAALDLPVGARAAFLDRACGSDAALRDDVDRLVHACERVGHSSEFLAEPAAAFAAPLVAEMDVREWADRGPDPLSDEDGDTERAAAGGAIPVALQAGLAGRYAVEREIGAGGMATVYLAEDVKHHRRVAIKLLRPELGAMVGVERFLAEIRVTANLQHPNLLPLFDSGEANGLLYYVMPYVNGESLRARLDRERQLPVPEALRLAVAVAGALDHAHRHGVIHRDLKPENILLHDGEPLVADFGIALAVSRAGGTRLTRRGRSLGTPRYMSPEQAAADRALDARSDVYSLACVLYEMLTGDPPHTGSTIQAVVARILTEQPRPVRTARASVPGHVEAALDRALSKLPADRFASARDFADALGGRAVTFPIGSVTTQPVTAEPPTGGRPRARFRDPVLLALGVAAVLGGGSAAWLWARGRDTPAARTARFVVSSLGDSPRQGTPTITPDGSTLVHVGSAAINHALLVRRLDEIRARPLAGTEGALSAFVSPDGRWIGFLTTDDKLKKVPVDGGTPTVLAGVFRFSNARWGPNGVIVIDTYGTRGLSWLSDGGGALHPLTRVETARGESRHAAPLILPDRRSVVLTVVRQRGGPGTVIGDLAIAPLDPRTAGPVHHTLLGVSGREAVAFVDGWLLYTSADAASVMAVRLEPDAGRTLGSPVPVLQDSSGGIEGVTLADDGTLVYTRRRAVNEPVLVDTAGVAQRLLGGPGGPYMNPRLSPDGRRLAIQAASPQGNDVWVYDLASRTPTRLTVNGSAQMPVWTPDGRRIVFLDQSNGSAFWWQPADGTAPAQKLVDAGGGLAGIVTPDGRTVLFQRQVEGVWGIWGARVDGDRTPHPVLQEKFDDYMPAVSPDGRWLAYVSNATGRYEIYVRTFPEAGAPMQVSENGGTEPMWSPDGRRLFYRAERRMVAATLAFDPGLAVTARTALFVDAFDGEMPHRNYDVTRDGKRFVMVAAGTASDPETVIVLNWRAELRARLATAQ